MKMATIPTSNLVPLPGPLSTPGGTRLLNLFRCCISGASRQVRGTTGLSMVNVKGMRAREQLASRQPSEALCFRGHCTGHQVCLAWASFLFPVALHLGRHGNSALCWNSAVIAPHLRSDGQGQWLGIWWQEERLDKPPLESALVWLECRGSPPQTSALTQGFGLRQTALPFICCVALSKLHLPEIQIREKVSFIMRLW